jgi:adenine-specific DNA-methyltransferase
MNAKYEKLKTLLKELFQLDQPDLDFGLYRIMHAKSREVTEFLDKDLLPQVKQAFSEYKTADKAEIDKELKKLIAGIEAAGMNPSESPKVVELQQRLESEAVDIEGLENEVYDHLFSFFRRYYSEGDFLAKRVYKPGVYAIPYEGEEVVLHWANKDQYYIKTSEYLRDYAFRLRADDEQNPMRVHFRLSEVAEGEHGNIKAAEGRDRVFILLDGSSGTDFISEVDGDNGKELIICFEYRPATVNDWTDDVYVGKTKAPAQKDLISLTVKRVLAVTNTSLVGWINELAKSHVLRNGETAEYSRLEAHLKRYSARNTFDYFIHKELGTFLRRELDFYIKNEVMHLHDVECETAARVEQYLSKIKVIRRIAGKIIDFLAQLEDFQKKLWLKKKFVVEASYRITLDLISIDLYREIALNEDQRREWEALFAIDKLDDYSVPLNEQFLLDNPYLPLNTSYFSQAVTESIVSGLSNHQDSVNGLLVHSDNFQALNLLSRGLKERIRCIYIDPPYNTDMSAIPYKNDYKHSSYATMINDRASLLRLLLEKRGILFVSIDKHERTIVEFALNEAFGSNNRIEELIWTQNTNDGRSPTYSVNHEYVEVYAKHRPSAEADPRIFREPKPGYMEVIEFIQELNPGYPKIEEIEEKLRSFYRKHRDEYRSGIEEQGLAWADEQRNDPWNGIYQYKFAEYRDKEGVLVPESEVQLKNAQIWVYRESDWTIMSAEDKQSESIYDSTHSNYRFYQPAHPITGKPCAMPSRAWKGTQFIDPKHLDRNSWESLMADHRLALGPDETKVPQQKRMLHEVETNVAKSVFADYSDGEKETAALFGKTGVFLAPKHTNFVRRFLRQVVAENSIVLDCFGGSGSTGHAVIRSNREDGSNLKFILIEVSNYFDTVLLPRVLKAAYSSHWKSGQPEIADGVSTCIKILRLESYEDALNNLDTRRTDTQQLQLDAPDAQGPNGFKEQYLLRYMLNVETQGSQSLLNVKAFTDPTAYKLKVKRPGSDESREVNVDLLETFNWLIGLTVKHIAAPQTFSAEFQRDDEKRLRLSQKSRLKLDPKGPFWFRTVTGTTPDGRKTLVIWRKFTSEIEQDNLVLDEWFTKQGYSSKDAEFDLIYVNGTNNLENLKTPDDLWKVRLIEEDFHRLMFDTEEN